MEGLVHLVNVYNEVEAEIVEALLEANEIKVAREYPKNSGITKIIFGTPLGVDIFVRNQDYELAKQLIDSDEASYESPFDFEENDLEIDEDDID